MARTIIEFDRQRVIVASVETAGQKVVIQTASSIQRSEEAGEIAQIAEKLRQLIPSSSKSPTKVTLVLPRQQVTFHRITLPAVGDHEIPDMVRMQAAMRLTVPVESVYMDFAPLPIAPGSSTRDVILVTSPTDQLNQIRNLLKSCQLELEQVRVSSFCVAAAAAESGLLTTQPDKGVVDILVWLHRSAVEITFVSGTSVVFAHSGAAWSDDDGIEKAVRSELNRARMAASEVLGEHRFGRLLLIGSPAVTSAVSDQMAARLNSATIERIDPVVAMFSGALPPDTAGDELVAVAGAVALDAARHVESVDLINPRKAPEKRDLRRVKILGGALAALLVFALLWNWRQNKLAELMADQTLLDEETSEIRSELSRGEPDLQLASNVQEWVDRDINWLDEIQKLNELLPGTERILIRNFQFGTKLGVGLGTIRIDGTARTREDVESLARRLDAAGYLVNPYTPGEARVSGPYPVGITLQLTIPERTEQQKPGKA